MLNKTAHVTASLNEMGPSFVLYRDQILMNFGLRSDLLVKNLIWQNADSRKLHRLILCKMRYMNFVSFIHRISIPNHTWVITFRSYNYTRLGNKKIL
jgi:hypothetical protein